MESLQKLSKLFYVLPPVIVLSFHQLLSKRINENKEEFHENYEENRDTTRPGNKSFGLNYGFKTDMAIEEMLDTGDLIFMQQVCSKSFSFSEMFHCFKQKALKSVLSTFGIQKSDWDTSGLLFRDRLGPRVLFYSYNEIYDLEYGEVLSLPFFQDISARKLRTKEPGIGYVGNEFRAQIINEKLEKGFWEISDPAELIVKYWKYTDLTCGLEGFIPNIETIDCAHPEILKRELVEYSEPIILRTELSKIEAKNY